MLGNVAKEEKLKISVQGRFLFADSVWCIIVVQKPELNLTFGKLIQCVQSQFISDDLPGMVWERPVDVQNTS